MTSSRGRDGTFCIGEPSRRWSRLVGCQVGFAHSRGNLVKEVSAGGCCWVCRVGNSDSGGHRLCPCPRRHTIELHCRTSQLRRQRWSQPGVRGKPGRAHRCHPDHSGWQCDRWWIRRRCLRRTTVRRLFAGDAAGRHSDQRRARLDVENEEWRHQWCRLPGGLGRGPWSP